MELRQLAHFIAVAEEGSFTRASQRVQIVQSGISASVSGLERELGALLFRRSKLRVELTPAGRAMLVEARRCLAAAAAGAAAARSAGGSLSGTLTIGMSGVAPAMLHLTRAFKDFHRSHPNVSMHLSETSRRDFDQLRAETMDVLIVSGHGPPGITSVVLGEWPMVLACAETHPFAERTSVDLRAIVGEPFIDVPAGSVTRTFVDRAFADAGLNRHTVAEVRGVTVLMSLLREGFGVSLIPPLGGQVARGVRFIPVSPGIGTWELTASYLEDGPRNPAAREFLAMIERGPIERRRR